MDLEESVQRIKQLNYLLEQNSSLFRPGTYLTTTKIGQTGIKIMDGFKKFENFLEVIRPDIENRGKKLFPANDLAGKNPNFKKTIEYRTLKDKEDAFDHQLSSAVLTSLLGIGLADTIGVANEIKGGLRIFFKGLPSKGIGRFEEITSGWNEDNANNSIGVEIAKKYPNKDINFYQGQVLNNINSKNYFDSTGKKVK